MGIVLRSRRLVLIAAASLVAGGCSGTAGYPVRAGSSEVSEATVDSPGISGSPRTVLPPGQISIRTAQTQLEPSSFGTFSFNGLSPLRQIDTGTMSGSGALSSDGGSDTTFVCSLGQFVLHIIYGSWADNTRSLLWTWVSGTAYFSAVRRGVGTGTVVAPDWTRYGGLGLLVGTLS